MIFGLSSKQSIFQLTQQIGPFDACVTKPVSRSVNSITDCLYTAKSGRFPGNQRAGSSLLINH